MDTLGEMTATSRGFSIVKFKDGNGHDCSLQCSSAIRFRDENEDEHDGLIVPGTSLIWLGVDDLKPKVMASEAHLVGINTSQRNGWVDYPIPSEVLMHNRMHLDRSQVKALIGHLQNWLNEGTF